MEIEIDGNDSCSSNFKCAGTYADMGTCPHYILGKGLENILFLNVTTGKYSIFEFCPHQT